MGQRESYPKLTDCVRGEHAHEDQMLAVTPPKKDYKQAYKRTEAEKIRLQQQKEALERRLGKLMSALLLDSNPAITDLSDPNRSTKLDDQFSSLYIHEWMEAYMCLQDLHFSQQHIIQILLDVLMFSYEFCRFKLEGTWIFVQKWFLVKDSSSVETIKALKDGRKQNILKHIPEIQEEFYLEVRELFKSNKRLTDLINKMKVQSYINKCIKLCLMMNACDPPVFLEIPEWKPLKERGGDKQESKDTEGVTTNSSIEEIGDGRQDIKDTKSVQKHRSTEEIGDGGQDIKDNTAVTTHSNMEEIEGGGQFIKDIKGDTIFRNTDEIEDVGQYIKDNKGVTTESKAEEIGGGGKYIKDAKGVTRDNETEPIGGCGQDIKDDKGVTRESITEEMDGDGKYIRDGKGITTDSNTEEIGDRGQYINENKGLTTNNETETIGGCGQDIKDDKGVTRDSITEEMGGGGKHIRDGKVVTTDSTDLNKRPVFDQNKFTQFTRGGKYVEYYVWPVVYLHEHGDVLSKGIAQGTDDPITNL
ncbi:uncharacterized protein LOC127843924 isoform X3 [Dreissena polymorpha]|uniref:uncharacterized protein LOC127843924 isoform X3 n=1 Tax=Dreissena polymorpha TaxID=45954 RepID=UPI00226521F9|nr:uncharacterized protein LOC127843924 isoform X3 [Dreissena polymorpha]